MELLEDILNMNSTEYKQYHESYMQNNNGTTMLHTFACVFFTVQCAVFTSIDSWDSTRLELFYEYAVIVVPLIAAHTVLANYVYHLNMLMSILILFELLQLWRNFDLVKQFKKPNMFKTNRVQAISCIRALTYLITVCCILAVDFKCFPRYLSKTERYGYSLMDTGVGLFVMMSGLVHKEVKRNNYKSVLKGTLKFKTILILLGISRFYLVKLIGYQEHVTEYGVHWNFFFTIAACKLLSTLMLLCTDHAFVLSIATLVLHEGMLFFGVEGWVFRDIPRLNFIDANREGISSCLGYASMYFFAVHVKNVLTNKQVIRHKVLSKLLLSSIALWTLSYLVNEFRPTSRTLANAGYCLYIEAIVVTVVGFMYIFEVLFENKFYDMPLILSAVNYNGLIFFLAANILTGLINMSVRTLTVTQGKTLVVLNAYMILTICIIIILKHKKFKL